MSTWKSFAAAEPMGFEAQTLVEFDIERCLLTLTSPEDGLPSGHTVWRAPEAP